MRIYYMNLQAEKITGIGKVELLITIVDAGIQVSIKTGGIQYWKEMASHVAVAKSTTWS
jgi:hypothetical protein